MILRALVLTSCIFSTAHAVDLGPVTSAKPLFTAAMDAPPDDLVTGLLSGPMAQRIHAKYPGTRAIHMEAQVVRRFKQEGCARFSLRIVPDGLPAGAPRDMTLELNWCLDGSAPENTEAQP